MYEKEPTTDATKILHQRFVKNDPEMLANIEEDKLNIEVAKTIFELRKNAGLTQKQLADTIGTAQSAISRLEDADYDGHSLSMLSRIAFALDKKIQIQFVDLSQDESFLPAHV